MVRVFVVLISTFLLISPACKHRYDEKYTPCQPLEVDEINLSKLDEIKDYLAKMGKTSYIRSTRLGIYYSISNAQGSPHPVNPIKLYTIEYEAYLVDGTPEKKETIFDTGFKKQVQPYLGPYSNIRLRGFGPALALLQYPTNSERISIIDFYMISDQAFGQCGWNYSKFNVSVPPDVPVHFIVKVHHSD